MQTNSPTIVECFVEYSMPSKLFWLCEAAITLGEVVVAPERSEHTVERIALELLRDDVAPDDRIFLRAYLRVRSPKRKLRFNISPVYVVITRDQVSARG